MKIFANYVSPIQNQPLLLDDSLYVPLHHHWPLLRRGLSFHWPASYVHSYRQLPFWIRSLARPDLPGHHYLSHDVCSNLSIDYPKWLFLLFMLKINPIFSAVYVQARHAFNSNGQNSKLGVKAFAFMWTASACLFLSCLMYCLGGAVGRKDDGYSGRKERRRGFFNSARSNSVRSQKKESYA